MMNYLHQKVQAGHLKRNAYRRPQKSQSPPRPAGLATLSPRKRAFERPGRKIFLDPAFINLLKGKPTAHQLGTEKR